VDEKENLREQNKSRRRKRVKKRSLEKVCDPAAVIPSS